MSALQRIELRIDIFDLTQQRAQALPNLSPPQLVEAILQEFTELEYLGALPENYQLLKAADNTPLDNEQSLQAQLGEEAHLILQERPLAALPAETRPPSRHIYLRESKTGKVFKLNWLPVIIGRPDRNQAHNDWVAVNLASFETGMRVSRRHAIITEQGGKFYIQKLSKNPVTLLPDKTPGQEAPVGAERRPLHPNDLIRLDRSGISLKFLVR